jgi:hypothetical protein
VGVFYKYSDEPSGSGATELVITSVLITFIGPD